MALCSHDNAQDAAEEGRVGGGSNFWSCLAALGCAPPPPPPPRRPFFLASLRGVPTADAEGLSIESDASVRKVSVRRVLRHLPERRGSSAVAVGVLRDIDKKKVRGPPLGGAGRAVHSRLQPGLYFPPRHNYVRP